ncbi:MAG: polysaccharide biosynthesis/export family protein [Chitinophagaceae bacterium]
MFKKIIYIFLLVPAVAGLFSCKTSKQLPYFQDLPEKEPVTKIATPSYEPLKLQANDDIQVTISSTSPEASQFFNLVAVTPPSGSSNSASVGSPALINLYHVSFSGNITMPVLGDIKVAGLTTEQVKADISERLKDYLKNAVVTVNLTNFKVTVIGEVNKPVVIPVQGQTINVLEAVGASGDMTVFGIRKNVKIIRKLPDGTTEVAILDFNKSNVMQSPYFQLKQNDIVYIQPNKSRGLQATRSGIWIPIVTTLISVAAIIITRK